GIFGCRLIAGRDQLEVREASCGVAECDDRTVRNRRIWCQVLHLPSEVVCTLAELDSMCRVGGGIETEVRESVRDAAVVAIQSADRDGRCERRVQYASRMFSGTQRGEEDRFRCVVVTGRVDRVRSARGCPCDRCSWCVTASVLCDGREHHRGGQRGTDECVVELYERLQLRLHGLLQWDWAAMIERASVRGTKRWRASVIRTAPTGAGGYLSPMPERIRTRFLVVGSGVAGLHTAWRAADSGEVVVLTKRSLFDSATAYAQGGIAAALGAGYSPELHRIDTLAAGAALCDAAAVE